MELTKQLHQLPDEVLEAFKTIANIQERNDYITTLRHQGWTLDSIGSATGMTRERIRQIVGNPNHATIISPHLPLPTPPAKPEKVYKYKRELHPDTEARLKELHPLASKVRFKSTKYRDEAEEFTRLLHHANTVEDVTLNRIAKILGVTRSALHFRLIRYGYIPAPDESNTLYAPLKHRAHTTTEE